MSPAPHKKPPSTKRGLSALRADRGRFNIFSPRSPKAIFPPLYEEGGLFRYGGMRADEGIGPYNEIP